MVNSKVSIIIPHHNNFDILNECINSLKKIKYTNIEIIIIDNNSSDESINKIKDTHSFITIKNTMLHIENPIVHAIIVLKSIPSD